MELCRKCGVAPGSLHQLGCGLERCARCGLQFICCDCSEIAQQEFNRLPWSGRWPGAAECEEFGWYTRLDPQLGWTVCDKNHPDARPDLNRLFVMGRWDPIEKKWFKS